jgi:diacylglycerol kinase family enzyme
MRLTLVHNPTAGEGSPCLREELLVGLRRSGHDVRACIDDIEGADAARCLTDPGDAIVVAGGDGSVRRVAMHVIGRGVPIAILPTGTANNIARALGLPRDPAQAIRQLDATVPWHYDVGGVTAPWGRNVFLEGAGFGPFVRTALLLSNPSQKEAFDHSDAKLTRDRQILEGMVRHYVAQECEIALDDETMTGTFLAMHVMNLSSVGPNLQMAPGADPSDGYLDVVLVRDSDRTRYADFVAAHPRGRNLEAPFQVRRTRNVRLRWQGAEVHVDDDFYQPGEPAELHVHVVPGELTFLRPSPRT